MAFEGASTSTPTGRVSKAKKGKRVHACGFEGCGKVRLARSQLRFALVLGFRADS